MPQGRIGTDQLKPPELTSAPEDVREHELPLGSDDGHEHGHIESFDLIRIGVAAIAAGLVWFHVWEPFPQVSVLGISGVLFGGWPIFHEALVNLRERRMTMELSMTIALLAALGIG